jgi:lipopolysaccharide transport system permease protein
MVRQRVTAEDLRSRVVIQPSRGLLRLNLMELWAYRELLYFFTWRDVKVRYKQTVLGVLWAILQPVLAMLVFTVFFGNLANIPSNGVPYPAFSYAGLLPWTYFATALAAASDSLVVGSNLLTKVYFPRVLMPLASTLSGLLDLAIAFVVLVGLALLYGIHPTASIVWLPAFVALALAAALGVGLWLSALNVKYRDVRYAVPFMIQVWLFATPVAYPSTLVPARWRAIFGLNPMAEVVEGF